MRGFTIVELVVVAGIIGILTVVVIANQSSFRSTILLKNTASDIALSLRNAQIFGTGSRSTASFIMNVPYGAAFSIGDSYIFFADTDPAVAAGGTPASRPGNGYYTTSDSSVQTYTLNNGMTVSNFCAKSLLGTWYCSTGGGVTSLAITFARPNPDATFTIFMGSALFVGQTLIQACISIKDPADNSRHVAVNLVGQITFTTSCPAL